jgi:hypothetical protein
VSEADADSIKSKTDGNTFFYFFQGALIQIQFPPAGVRFRPAAKEFFSKRQPPRGSGAADFRMI